MNEEEIKERLAKLEEYEAEERRKARWQPYRELEDHIAHMEASKRRLEEAAMHQDEASEICSDFDIDLTTYGRADIWDAFNELENRLNAKYEESEELYNKLKEEDE